MKTFTTAPSRKDRHLTVFSAVGDDGAELLKAICSNSTTGYVRSGLRGAVLVPNHAASAVRAHLTKLNWAAA